MLHVNKLQILKNTKESPLRKNYNSAGLKLPSYLSLGNENHKQQQQHDKHEHCNHIRFQCNHTDETKHEDKQCKHEQDNELRHALIHLNANHATQYEEHNTRNDTKRNHHNDHPSNSCLHVFHVLHV